MIWLLPVVIYAVLGLALLVFQRRLIYFPTKIPADVVVRVGYEHGFAPWKNAAGEIIGWKMAAHGAATASVLIVHGNAGCGLGRGYLAQPIHEASSVDVYVLEYPGYGARAGTPSKDSFVAAGVEAFQALPSYLPRYVVSESLGTGVAAELARKYPQEVTGLAMIVPYCSLAAVAQKKFWFMPTWLFLIDRFHPQKCLADYRGPAKFVVAGQDEIIPAKSGIHMYERFAGPKELEVFEWAQHNDVSAQSPAWWREVFRFWQQHPVMARVVETKSRGETPRLLETKKG